jgi:hypothetical protein
MFNLVCKTLDNLAPDWRKRIISVTTDGASSMTGHRQGVASRLERVALPGFFTVCGVLFTNWTLFFRNCTAPCVMIPLSDL